MKLYHGSKNLINGKIAPISRSECDFGKGFYMSESKHLCEAWVCNDVSITPHVYELDIDLNSINHYQFEMDRDWYLYIARNRQPEKINKYPKVVEYLKKFDSYDMLIGTIADDRLIYSMNEFFIGNINEKALIACLNVFNYGLQYVAKNEKACGIIKIISDYEIDDTTRNNNIIESKHRIESVKDVVEQVKVRYRNDKSKYFDEILEEF